MLPDHHDIKPDQRMVNKTKDFTVLIEHTMLNKNKLTHLQVLIGLTCRSMVNEL